jgi:hypothetical protein
VDSETIDWLHDDSARVFELMVEHEIDVTSYVDRVNATEEFHYGEEYFKDHNNDKALATRVAILRCLIRMKE